MQKNYQNGIYNKEQSIEFAEDFLIGRTIIQKRYISSTLTEDAVANYAKKILWKEINIMPQTTAASIESFNIERLAEAEILLPRNSKLYIKSAEYIPEEDRWIYKANLQQTIK